MKRLIVRLKGVSFESRQQAIASLSGYDELRLIREPMNSADHNAIAVATVKGDMLGYVSRSLAKILGPLIDLGIKTKARLSCVMPGGVDKVFGDPIPTGVKIEVLIAKDSSELVFEGEEEAMAKKPSTKTTEATARKAIRWSAPSVVAQLNKVNAGKLDAAAAAQELGTKESYVLERAKALLGQK